MWKKNLEIHYEIPASRALSRNCSRSVGEPLPATKRGEAVFRTQGSPNRQTGMRGVRISVLKDVNDYTFECSQIFQHFEDRQPKEKSRVWLGQFELRPLVL